MRVSNLLWGLFSLFLIVIFGGCSSSKEIIKQPPQEQEVYKKSSLKHVFEDSEVFSDNFTGFILYDPETDSVLYAQNEKKYFTPASNTKLFTFYAGLKTLPDSIPGMQYIIKGDSLIFRGTGDPSFLHPDFGDPRIYRFLKQTSKHLYYTDEHFEDEVLGPGWSWSDFNYYYSAEKSPFPIFGNVMRVTVEEIEIQQIASDSSGLKVSPTYFRSKIKEGGANEKASLIERGFFNNEYTYVSKADTITYTTDKPFHYTPELITALISDTLDKPVEFTSESFPEDFETMYSVQTDSIFKRMLQPSDNFIAEQLLLTIASQIGKPLNSRLAIDYVTKTFFKEMPDEPQWVDGSGLSRYNMFTPRSIIWLLMQIDSSFEDDQDLFNLLPAGGESGTIKNWYASPDSTTPYVYAKTGTLSNNHCLSGYLITQSGKKLYFSFMNNHYITSSTIVKNEMEKVLQLIRATY